MSMAPGADAAILDLAASGIILDPDTEQAFRAALAAQHAAAPASSKSTVKRVAAQQSSRKRRSGTSGREQGSR